jgi:type III secretion system low calcium response chaperone LcrH/SycD
MSDLDKYKLKIDEAFIKKMNEMNWVDQSIKDANYFQQVLGVSNEVFEVYYRAAAFLLEAGRFEEARDAFLFLSFLNPFLHNVWMGAGIAQQSLGHYEEACNAYFMAEVIEPHDPYMHANTFQCFIALNDNLAAKESLDLAIESCGSSPEFEGLRKQLLPLKDSMKKVA